VNAVEQLRKVLPPKAPPVPKEVQERCWRGRKVMMDGAPRRNKYLELWRNNHYAWIDENNLLQQMATVTSTRGTGKPPWLERRTVNLIFDAVEHEVSSATQRVPSYDVAPSTVDQEDKSAAELAKKVLLYGFEKWGIRRMIVQAVRLAVVAEEAFIWPYWDSSVGPMLEGESVGKGEVRHRVFSGNQTYWEPGVKFDDSRWWAVEYGLPADQVQEFEGYLGGELTPDAEAQQEFGKGQDKATMTKTVLVTEYLERPCPKYPNGRWLTLANKRMVVEPRDYPYVDGKNQVVDEPVLHRLVYADDPDHERGVGLVRHLEDSNRMYNWARSRLMEYAKIGLVPQAVVAPGLMRKQRMSAESGKILEIPNPAQNFQWRPNNPPPRELFEMLSQAQQEIGILAAQNAIPSQVEAGRAIQALIERDQNRHQTFLANLADVYASVGRHDLMLTQGHYTEDRLVKIKGSFGWESINDFLGADLRGEADVRVLPESIVPRTRESIEQRIYVAMQNGWLAPEKGMHALETGSADDLVKDIDLAIGRVHRVIQLIKQGADALLASPTQITSELDPLTGGPVIDPETMMPRLDPVWMPQEWDNLGIWKAELQAWFQTEEAEHLEPPMQEARNLVYSALLMQEARMAQRAAEQQQLMAESLGAQNAAKPQGQPKPLPDQVAPPPGNPAPTQNQPANQSIPT
jgi:hypothetical protein